MQTGSQEFQEAHLDIDLQDYLLTRSQPAMVVHGCVPDLGGLRQEDRCDL